MRASTRVNWPIHRGLRSAIVKLRSRRSSALLSTLWARTWWRVSHSCSPVALLRTSMPLNWLGWGMVAISQRIRTLFALATEIRSRWLWMKSIQRTRVCSRLSSPVTLLRRPASAHVLCLSKVIKRWVVGLMILGAFLHWSFFYSAVVSLFFFFFLMSIISSNLFKSFVK